MSRLDNFLKNLEDYELAAFYKYRFETFIPSTQENIVRYLNERNIDISTIDLFIESTKKQNQDKKSNKYCPRCYSKHFYMSNERDVIYEQWSSYELNNEFKTCLVCLYSDEKKNYIKEKKQGWTIFSTIRFLRKRGK